MSPRPEVVEIAANYIIAARDARHKTEEQILEFLSTSKVVDMTKDEILEAYKAAKNGVKT